MQMGARATAVLLNWRRSRNLPAIIDEMAKVPDIRRVLIWNNSIPLSADDLFVREIVKRPRTNWPELVLRGLGYNVGTYGRYLAAREFCTGAVDNPVLTQDDDYIVHNWPEILDEWRGRPGSIVAALAPGHLASDNKRRWQLPEGGGTLHEVLLGWGSAFPWCLCMYAFEAYRKKHGEDGLLFREADRVFTLGCVRQHLVIPNNVTAMGDSDEAALWTQDCHDAMIRKVRTRVFDLYGMKYEHKGW